MAELEDDIARVARLRGLTKRQVDVTIVRAHELEQLAAERARQYWALERGAALDNLWVPMDGTVREQMAAYDRLPPKSRAFLAEIARDISARRYEIALEIFDGDEDRLMETIKERLAPASTSW